MPLSRYVDPKVLDHWFGVTAPTPATPIFVGLVLQCGQLSTALTVGTSITSLACATATAAYAGINGDTILVGTGATTQTFQASALWSAAATSISVVSQIANAQYAIGTPFIRCDTYAVAQEPAIGSFGYARVSYANTVGNFPNATLSGIAYLKQNANTITFPTDTGTNWGTVAGFLISDASSAGNVYCYGMLNAAQLISVGNTPSFAINALSITEL